MKPRFLKSGTVGLLTALCFGLYGLAPTSAQAATFNVSKTTDSNDGACNADCSLREAIVAANNAGGADTINIPAGTYTLTIPNTGGSTTTSEDSSATGDLDVTGPVTIVGDSATTTIIESGAANDKIFSFNPLGSSTGFAVSLSNVTLRNGKNTTTDFATGNNIGGALDFDAGSTGVGSLNISNCILTNNQTLNGDGGAIGLFDGGTVTIFNSVISNNTIHSEGGVFGGGAIYMGDSSNPSTLTITQCAITGNSAPTENGALQIGGGLFLADATGNTIFSITRSQISGNSAGGGGGGIHSDTPLSISNSTLSGNTSGDDGGAIHGQDTTLSNVTIANNTASDQGSAIFHDDGSLRLNHTIVAGSIVRNTANGATVDVARSTFNVIEQSASANGLSNGVNGNIVGTSAGLDSGGLQDNGGVLLPNGAPTLTIKLSTASAAYNAGDPAFSGAGQTDQRGGTFVRVAKGRLDIGAFELQPLAPTNLVMNQSFVAEKQPLNTYVGSFITTDPDAGDTFTYSLVTGTGDDNNASFVIAGPSLRTNAVFDASVKTSYSVRVRTTDQNGLFFEKSFTITITEASPPTLTVTSPTSNQKILIANFDGNAINGTATDNVAVAAVKVRLGRKRNNVNEYWNGTDFAPTSAYLDAIVTGTTNATWRLANVPPAGKLDSGLYQVDVYALDTTGNKSATVSRPFTLGADFLIPEVAITTPTLNSTNNANAFVAGFIKGTATDDMGVVSVKLKLQRKRGTVTTYWNGTAFTTTVNTVDATVTPSGGTSVNWSYNSAIPSNQLDNGTYTLYATAYDAAGNFKTSAALPFGIVITPPGDAATSTTGSKPEKSAGSS